MTLEKKHQNNILITPEFQDEVAVIRDFFKEKIWVTLINSNVSLLDIDDYQWKILISKIKEFYNNNDNVFLDEFTSLYNDSNYFKSIINSYLSESLSTFLTNDYINIFNELSFYFYSLWWFKNNDILIDLDNINFIQLDILLKSHENKIISDFNNKEVFINIEFSSYINLLEVLNKVCAFYTFDSNRKLLISEIISYANKSLENIYNNIISLDWSKYFLEKLDFYKWKFLLNFSHIDYIDNHNLWITESLINFQEIFDSQTKWYNLIKENLSDNELQDFFYNIYVWNVSYSLSTMFKKLELRNVEDIINNNIYIKIVEKYKLNIYKWDDIDCFENNFDFKSELLDNFLNLYNYNDNIIFSNNINDNIKLILNDFIAWDKNYNEFQIESIHHILLFSDSIELTKLIEITNTLINVWKYNNYNFEFFKLITISVIIDRLDSADVLDSPLIKIFLDKVVKYVEENIIASQLLNSYSKIYLALSKFYSKSWNIDDLNNSKKYVTKFLLSQWQIVDIWEWSMVIYNEIQKNIWKNTDIIKWTTWTKWWLEIKQYHSYFELSEEIFIHNKFSNFLVEAFDENWEEFEDIVKKMSNIISINIFHWVTNVFIDWPELDNSQDKRILNVRWFNSKKIDIIDWYSLFFYYPKNFESIFLEIYSIKEKFINKKITTLIKVFLQKRADEIDKLTWLYNYTKLNKILNLKKWEELSFINLKLSIIKTFNNAYWYEKWDLILKKISNLLKNYDLLKWNVFRLSWVQIWILLYNNTDVKEILNFIKTSTIVIDNVNLKINANIWIVENEKISILEKSNMVLSKLKNNWDNVWFYSQSSNNSEENRNNIYYLKELENALENNLLTPYYQPIVSSKKWNEVVKYECLLRVIDSNWNVNSPYHFLNIASDIWKLREITFIMLDKVFSYASLNSSDYSINLWSEDLNLNTLSYIDELLSKYSLKWKESRFTFEILESSWWDWENFLEIIKSLKNKGFKIAMDDFWAESSNLNRYLELVETWLIDIVKLDMVIVKALVDDEWLEVESTASLIRWIIDSAHTNNIEVIAEYVENENIAYYLKRLKVDLFQWFYYWKPNFDLSILK